MTVKGFENSLQNSYFKFSVMPCDTSISREGVTEYYEDYSKCWFEECDFYDYDEDDDELYCANYYWYKDPTCEPVLIPY